MMDLNEAGQIEGDVIAVLVCSGREQKDITANGRNLSIYMDAQWWYRWRKAFFIPSA